MLSKNEGFVKAVVGVLHVFRSQSATLCQEKTVTLSKVLPCLLEMYAACETSPDDLMQTAELKRFLRGQLVARFGREDAVRHSFERRVGALDNIYFAATALDPRTMFSVGEGNYEATWARAEALCTPARQPWHYPTGRACPICSTGHECYTWAGGYGPAHIGARTASGSKTVGVGTLEFQPQTPGLGKVHTRFIRR